MCIRRLKTVLAAIFLTFGVAIVGSVSFANEPQANTSRPKFELAKQYYGQCSNTDNAEFDVIRPQLNAFTDMEVMAQTMADPAKFMQLMTVVNDPRTIHVMTRCATEPVMWDTWMSGMTDFNKMSRAMGHFMNPNMYMSWMMAPMNPAMYQPMMQMADPQYYTRWMNAVANPAFYQPITSLADPDWYTPRINWMMNPQSMQPMFSVMSMGNYFAPASTASDAAALPAN